jgi:hypothetical protein
MKRKFTDDEMVQAYRELGSPIKVAQRFGVSERALQFRRAKWESQTGEKLTAWNAGNGKRKAGTLLTDSIQNGTVIIGSDAHYWPDMRTTAHRGFLWACKTLKPGHVILNGDIFDGASVSRHPPIGWETKPTVKQEISAVSECLAEIAEAAGKARKVWTSGNHDDRFENRLAHTTPEYNEVTGFRLRDHVIGWECCEALTINEHTIILHNWKGGVHAAFNNAKESGWNFFTGHLHSLAVSAYTDLRGTRYGGDSGTMADVDGPQFAYRRHRPANWRSGFLVLTFKDGELLWPEPVSKFDEDNIQFRGEVIPV